MKMPALVYFHFLFNYSKWIVVLGFKPFRIWIQKIRNSRIIITDQSL